MPQSSEGTRGELHDGAGRIARRMPKPRYTDRPLVAQDTTARAQHVPAPARRDHRARWSQGSS